MNASVIRSGVVALFVFVGVPRVAIASQTTGVTPPSTQAPAPSPAPARAGTSPEAKIYSTALAVKDPTEKLAALRKFQADYPSNSLSRTADSAILTLLLANFKDRTDDIRTTVDAVIANLPATSPPDIRVTRVQAIAVQLVDAGVLIDRAKALVTEAVVALDRPDYIKRTRETREKARAAAEQRQKTSTTPVTTPPVPSDQMLGQQFDRIMAGAQEVMGRIHLATGDAAAAEREFRAAVAANPQLGKASLELSKIESSRGNDRKALDLYLAAAATGKLKRAEEEGLATLYKKVNGDTANLERDLDRVYRERFPNPIAAPEPFTGTRGGRVALLEMFTGSACGPCVAADLALDGVLERYPADSVAVLAYHVHIPGPDPMTVPDSVTRKNLYAVPGVPTFNVDGARARLGGGPRESAQPTYDTYVKSIDASLASAPEAQVKVSAEFEGDKVRVRADVQGVKTGSKPLRLHLVLAERELTFLGENGIRHHPFVVRDLAGDDAEGLPLPAADGKVDYTFDLTTVPGAITTSLADDIARRRKNETSSATPREYRAEGRPMTAIDRSHLVVVAFVQEAGDKPAARPDAGSTDTDDENPPPVAAGAPAPAYRVLQAVWTPVAVRR
jgi:thiol-disulfide isomerase/thioredoxin